MLGFLHKTFIYANRYRTIIAAWVALNILREIYKERAFESLQTVFSNSDLFEIAPLMFIAKTELIRLRCIHNVFNAFEYLFPAITCF
jgi:hypothetical protein